MDSAHSRSTGLTLAQGIGIGVVVGFFMALILACIVVYVWRSVILPRSPKPSPESPKPSPESPPVPLSRALSWEGGQRPWVKSLPARMDPWRRVEQMELGLSFGMDFEQLAYVFIKGEKDFADMTPVSESIYDEDQLVRLAGKPVNGGTWAESISNIQTRLGAVRCFLAQVIFKRMDPLCDVKETLLPPELAAFYQYFISYDGKIPLSFHEDARKYLAVLREIIYEMKVHEYNLLPEPPRPMRDNDHRRERIWAMASEIMEALHLEALKIRDVPLEIILRKLRVAFEFAANAAVVLFGQPSFWEVDWRADQPGFIVFPEVRLMWKADEVRLRMPGEVETWLCPTTATITPAVPIRDDDSAEHNEGGE